MAVLSTLQNYYGSIAQHLSDHFGDAPALDTIKQHKWIALGGTIVVYTLYKYLSRPRYNNCIQLSLFYNYLNFTVIIITNIAIIISHYIVKSIHALWHCSNIIERQ